VDVPTLWWGNAESAVAQAHVLEGKIMETARAEILDNLASLQAEPERDFSHLKSLINDILVSHLPPDLRLDEFEAIALGILTVIMEPSRFLVTEEGA
jgi:hypothetical protein